MAEDREEPKFTNHVFTYHYQGEEWLFTINASSKEDAEARVTQLQWANYQGSDAFMVPASMGWIMNVYCWVSSLFGRDREIL